jgi:hypothetical protein
MSETTVKPPYQRHEILSRSESGLTFVRDRKSGILRQLTEDELRDFSDPAPCEECGEQFGCTHYNCARERLLADHDIESFVPEQWIPFARAYGLSHEDLHRLASIQRHEGEYFLAPGAPADMRTQELVLLLNDFR